MAGEGNLAPRSFLKVGAYDRGLFFGDTLLYRPIHIDRVRYYVRWVTEHRLQIFYSIRLPKIKTMG